MKFVLDASAVLAVLQNERGQEAVLPHLRGGVISAVNYSEILKKTIENGGELQRTLQFLDAFTLVIIPFDREHAIAPASLWTMAKQFGLSFADRACLALGQLREACILTADGSMKQAKLQVEVRKIR